MMVEFADIDVSDIGEYRYCDITDLDLHTYTFIQKEVI